jgi:hypothetical protein
VEPKFLIFAESRGILDLGGFGILRDIAKYMLLTYWKEFPFNPDVIDLLERVPI